MIEVNNNVDILNSSKTENIFMKWMVNGKKMVKLST